MLQFSIKSMCYYVFFGEKMPHNMEITVWKHVRDYVKSVDSQLADLIDNIDPGDEYKIYKVEYPWGQHLMREGVLYLPNKDGKWVKLDDPSIDTNVAEDLFYNMNMPLGMVLNNSIELYLEALGRIMPWVFMPQGTLFGLWLSLSQNKSNNYYYAAKISNLVAGARSAILLPKISDTTSFKKLKKAFGLQCKMPETLTDGWPLFLELAQHADFPERWSTTVIYFSRKWLDSHDSIAWKMLKYYFLEIAWEKTSYIRNKIFFDLVFSCALEERNLKPNPYLTDTVKHIFAITQNSYPGYEIATNSLVLPLDGFQKIFVNEYGLRYQPTFVIPGYLDSLSKFLYYSLEVPTTISFSPKSRKSVNKLEDIREIKHIFIRIIDYLRENKLSLGHVPLFQLIEEIILAYYHSDEDMYNETSKTIELQKIDNNIIQENKKYNKPFCDTSLFLRGCIQISLNPHKKD